MKKSTRQKIAASILAATVAFAGVQNALGKKTVNASRTKNQTNTCLGTTKIAKPVRPKKTDDKWKGSYVYLGYYSGNSIKFRVLAPSTTAYGGSTLFLDSDKTLFSAPFYETTSSNSWANSDIKKTLNGSFLNNFTELEKAAIAESSVAGHPLESSNGQAPGKVAARTKADYSDYVALTGEKIFLLDVEEATNVDYGYSMADNDSDDQSIIKESINGTIEDWWLRSAESGKTATLGIIDWTGCTSSMACDRSEGVAPALNVDQSKIIFSTAVDGNLGDEYGVYYKLTLLDDNIKLSLNNDGKAMVSGTNVTLPCKVDGGDPNRISVLILDNEYKEATEIKYYAAVDDAYTFDFSETGLDINDWGVNYFVYVLGEKLNNDPKTDYACAPIKVESPFAATAASFAVKVNVRTVDTDGTTVITDNGGSASASAATASVGQNVTITATPNSGYTLKSIEWGDGAISMDITSTKEFSMEAYDVAIDVTFQKEAGTGTTTTTDPAGTSTGTTTTTTDPAGTSTDATTTTAEPAGTGTSTGSTTTTADPASSASTVTAAEPNTYTVVKGADGSWDGMSDYVIEIKSSSDDEHCIDRFRSVSDNGKDMNVGTDCLVTKGSTVITIKSTYLKALSVGSHKIVVTFADNTVSTTLTIKEANKTTTSGSSSNAGVPKTGDVQTAVPYAGMAMIVLACGIVSVLVVRKKREND